MPGSPEAAILFAVLKSRCAMMRPRDRVVFLKNVAEILEDWARAPPNLRSPGSTAIMTAAVELFRKELPGLLQ